MSAQRPQRLLTVLQAAVIIDDLAFLQTVRQPDHLSALLRLQSLDLVLLTLNLELLLLELLLRLSLLNLPILHRVANQGAADQAQASANRSASAWIAGDGADYSTSRGAAGRAVDCPLFAGGKRLPTARTY